MTTDARIRRAARALQAAHVAMTTTAPLPPAVLGQDQIDAYELHYATMELNYGAAMSFSDLDAMPAACLDPAHRGGWAWWAKRILDAADAADEGE